MPTEQYDQRLSLIPTLWSLVCRAHQGSAETAASARRQLLERYGGAARRYLGKILRNPDGADEVFQEFALRLLHGGLRGADPARGRFRNFVKGTLFHLIADYHKQQRKWPAPLPTDGASLAANHHEESADDQFVASWRDEILARVWSALAADEERTGQSFYAVLRFRADHPEVRSPQMAEQLSAQLGRSLTADGVRQVLHRARVKFAELLFDEVTHSLENPTSEQVADELIELGLLDFCRPILERTGVKLG